MKIEDITLDQSSQYLGEIERGESPFKFIPKNIGEFKFCYSTNYKACADSWQIRKKQYLKSIAIPCFVATLSWVIFNNSYVWNSIVSIVCVCIIQYLLKKISSFKGTDYFVGTNGFCVLDFDKSRDNIQNKFVITFDEVSDLITEQIHIKSNGTYLVTQYYVCFVSDQDSIIKYYEGGRYDKDDKNGKRVFYDKLIDSWKSYKLQKDFGKIPLSFNAFVIKNESIEDAYLNYVEVEDSLIRVHGKEYRYDEIKQMKFESQGGIGLLIEHKNHEIVKKSFWRKSETGDVEHIPLSALGNQEFVITYFQWLIATKELLHNQ